MVTCISTKLFVDYIMNMFHTGNREAVGDTEAGAALIEWENNLKRLHNK